MYTDYNKPIKTVSEDSIFSWHQLVLKQNV